MKKFVLAACLLCSITAVGIDFQTWRNLKFTPSEVADPSVSGKSADPDSDGRINWVEFALDNDPKFFELTAQPVTSLSLDGHLQMTYVRWKTYPGFIYVPQVSSDLGIWQSGLPYIAQVGIASRNDDTEFVTVEDLTSSSNASKSFIHLLIALDRDYDLLPDDWELHNGLSSFDPTDGNGDIDEDGTSNRQEFSNGTDPLKKPIPPPAGSPPNAPSDVWVEENADGSKDVYWTDNSNNEGYFVVRDHRPGGLVVELGRVGPDQTVLYVPAPQ